jgi:hypothetical protein
MLTLFFAAVLAPYSNKSLVDASLPVSDANSSGVFPVFTEFPALEQ